MQEIWSTRNTIESAYRDSYERFARFAYLLVGDAELARELVQEAFAVALKEEAKVRDVSAFVNGTILNLTRGHFRRAGVAARVRRLLLPPTDEPDHAGNVALWGSLARLPRRQYVCLVLRFHMDYSYADIAKAMGIAEGTAKSQVSRALAALRREGVVSHEQD